MSETKINPEVIESVTAKLQTFAEGLDENERGLLDALVASGSETDEVSGFNFELFKAVNIGTPSFKAPDFNSRLNQLFCSGGEWNRIPPDDEEIGRLRNF